MGSTTTIIAAIDAVTTELKARRAELVELNERVANVEAEVTRLTVAQESLGQLVTVDQAKEVRSPKSPATEQVDTPKEQRATRKGKKPGKMTPSEAGMALVESVIEQATATSGDAPKAKRNGTDRSLREERIENLAKARAAKVAKNGTKPNRREQIVSLLDKGLSPREIGNELGIAPNYVYHVKRDMA
jgi:hypothetical protein